MPDFGFDRKQTKKKNNNGNLVYTCCSQGQTPGGQELLFDTVVLTFFVQ